jgi:hypothetical protein
MGLLYTNVLKREAFIMIAEYCRGQCSDHNFSAIFAYFLRKTNYMIHIVQK